MTIVFVDQSLASPGSDKKVESWCRKYARRFSRNRSGALQKQTAIELEISENSILNTFSDNQIKVSLYEKGFKIYLKNQLHYID